VRHCCQDLGTKLTDCDSTLLKSAGATQLQGELAAVLEAINALVDEGAEVPKSSMMTTMQMCYCIKEGAHALLDHARETFNNLSTELQEQVLSDHWNAT
jgi:hypothetical protein